MQNKHFAIHIAKHRKHHNAIHVELWMHTELIFWIPLNCQPSQVFPVIFRRQRVRETAHPKSLPARVLFLIGVSTLSMHSSIRCKLQHAWLGLLHPNHSLLTGSACQLLQRARWAAVTAPLLFRSWLPPVPQTMTACLTPIECLELYCPIEECSCHPWSSTRCHWHQIIQRSRSIYSNIVAISEEVLPIYTGNKFGKSV